MIQGMQLEMSMVADHIGGPFAEEEKEFMIRTAQLEHKWRLGKKKLAEIESLRGTRESLTARTTMLMPADSSRVDGLNKVSQTAVNSIGRFGVPHTDGERLDRRQLQADGD